MRDRWRGIQVTVQSTHVDMFGHVNHARYLEYMEWSRFAWAEHYGFPLPELIREQGIGPAVVRANVSFLRECRLGDELVVTVEPTTARRGVGRVRQRVLDAKTEQVVCEAELTWVMLDLTSRKAVNFPPGLLAVLREQMAGEGGDRPVAEALDPE